MLRYITLHYITLHYIHSYIHVYVYIYIHTKICVFWVVPLGRYNVQNICAMVISPGIPSAGGPSQVYFNGEHSHEPMEVGVVQHV